VTLGPFSTAVKYGSTTKSKLRHSSPCSHNPPLWSFCLHFPISLSGWKGL
jgi:hypothetical protein